MLKCNECNVKFMHNKIKVMENKAFLLLVIEFCPICGEKL